MTPNRAITDITPRFGLGEAILDDQGLPYQTVNVIGGTVRHEGETFPQPIPEPGTAALVALGLLSLGAVRRGRR